MPPVNTDISERLREFGYEVIMGSSEIDRKIFEITGGELAEVTAFFRSDSDFCTAAFVIGVMQAVPERLRFSLLLDLLELNFGHPLASISLFRSGSQKDDSEGFYLILAQTAFFGPECTKEKVDGRLQALRAVGLAASKILAAKEGISNSNPFYPRLRPIQS